MNYNYFYTINKKYACKKLKVIAKYVALYYSTFDRSNPVVFILFSQPWVLSHLVRYRRTGSIIWIIRIIRKLHHTVYKQKALSCSSRQRVGMISHS